MNLPQTNKSSEASFFDALLALSQSLRLLVLGPLFVALVVVGMLLALPSRFTSQAIIMLSPPSGLSPGYSATAQALTGPQAAVVMKSAVVLDPVLLALNPGSENPGDDARNALAANIKASVAKDGLLRIDVTAASALKAQKTANLLIDAWLRTTKPAAQQQAELEARLTHARQTLSTTQKILETQKTSLSSMSGLGDLLDRYFAQTLDIQRQMNGLTRDVVIQAPTLASRPTEVPYVIIFFQVMFGAELFFVMWVLGRRALEAANANPDTAQKMEKLRDSLRGVGGNKNAVEEKLNRVDSA